MAGTAVWRVWVGAVAVALVGSACSGSRVAPTTVRDTDSVAVHARLAVGRPAWVSVSVATVWRSPGSPRPVDRPALADPARVPQWLADMSLDQRRALDGRADTQALLGDRVVVLALPSRRPGWARVAVPAQPSPLDARGYPGWVPRRQLATSAPRRAPRSATVTARTGWLLTDQRHPTRVFRVSMGTTLPVVGQTPSFVRVAVPGGGTRRVARGAVVVHDTGTPALAPSRASVVGTARRFLGLPYLWAGTSGFGLDCSGLTWLVYRMHGIRIPRDAAPQSRHGSAVHHPRRGDLLFYAAGGTVHHVSMYVGNGQMIHSPATGQSVQVVAVQPYARSRRYLP